MDVFEYPTELIDALVDVTLERSDRDNVDKLADAIADLCDEQNISDVMVALGIFLAGLQKNVEGAPGDALMPFVVMTIAERLGETASVA